MIPGFLQHLALRRELALTVGRRSLLMAVFNFFQLKTAVKLLQIKRNKFLTFSAHLARYREQHKKSILGLMVLLQTP